MKGSSLVLLLDATMLVAIAMICLHAILTPSDELVLAELITAGCFWCAMRVVIVYGCGGQLWPAPAAMFLIATLVTGHIGAFGHFADPVAVPQYGALRLIWGFNLGYLGIALGTYLYVRLLRLDTAKLVDAFYSRPLVLPQSAKQLYLPAAIIFAISLGIGAVLFQGSLPIFKSFYYLATGNFGALHEAGILSRSLVHSSGTYRGQGYLNQVRVALIPMISLLWLAQSRLQRELLLRVLAWFAVSAAILMAIAVLERGPVFIYIIQLVVLNMLMYRPKLSMKVAYGFIGAVGIYFLITNLLGRSAATNISQAMVIQSGAAAQRIFMTSSEVYARTFSVFPEELHFRWGQTLWDNILGLLPGQKILLSRELFVLFFGGATTGSASIHSFAEMWANAGYLGILIGSIIFGLLFQWVSVKMMTIAQKTPLHLTVWAMVAFLLAAMSLGPLTTPTDRGLISVLLLYAILKGFERISERTFKQAPVAAPETSLPSQPAVLPG